ncbi:MAG: polysaccharide biosynthesis/export family protein [Gemmataceae bacterium]|nr:polysaccharide biosynthesis/export family protein [Gemmataceae bacterium]
MPRSTSTAQRVVRPLLFCAGALLAIVGSGCAALTNPVADGVPVRRLPPELLARAKDDEATIPLTLLRQPPLTVHRLAPGDVLGIWVEGVLGDKALAPPIHVAAPVQIREQRRLAPALGYPVPVNEDGTVALPLIEPVAVAGLTVAQAQRGIAEVYVKKGILKAGAERVYVSLLQPRMHQVLVLRQESPAFTPGPEGVVSTGKRGTGHLLDLPAGENDVLHALTQTGGLPALDAYNAVIAFRGVFAGTADASALLQSHECNPTGPWRQHPHGPGGRTVYIPLRARHGEAPPLRPEDVILQTGDVIFLEARDRGLFYTAGLLPSGEHILPRDRDLDVIQAIASVRGPLLNGAFVTNNLAGNVLQPGIGNPSPSLLTVVRQVPGGGQVPIRVDLNLALLDPRERLLVKAGDVLILQEEPQEALARYLSNSFFNFSVAWQAIRGRFVTGVVDVNTPQNTPGRIGVQNIINRGP